ncbi:MAG: hypothetical protein V4636_23560 [Pseudomonadota bacterium]
MLQRSSVSSTAYRPVQEKPTNKQRGILAVGYVCSVALWVVALGSAFRSFFH